VIVDINNFQGGKKGKKMEEDDWGWRE
jgi:hypothetical protein